MFYAYKKFQIEGLDFLCTHFLTKAQNVLCGQAYSCYDQFIQKYQITMKFEN